MKRHLFIFMFLLLICADSNSQPRRMWDNSDYELVFADEFNGQNGSQPDPSKWVRCKRYNATWCRWVSNLNDVAFIKNGSLICRAIPNRNVVPGDTAKMLTGAIESKGKFSFQYGKVEVRMKTNNERGNFPAVWMKPVVTDKNNYGEIDIVETFGDLGVAKQTVHNHITTILKRGREFQLSNRISLNRWHIYGLEWTPTYLAFYIDGQLVDVFRKSSDSKDLADGQWTFDRPFYLIMNQSVGKGNYECMIPNLKHTYETQFDWIRVYQKKTR